MAADVMLKQSEHEKPAAYSIIYEAFIFQLLINHEVLKWL